MSDTQERPLSPKATCGRIVHYYHQAGAYQAGELAVQGALVCEAAIVRKDTGDEGVAELFVFQAVESKVGHSYIAVPYSPEPKAGHWSWMPYQKQKAQTERGNVSESAEPHV